MARLMKRMFSYSHLISNFARHPSHQIVTTGRCMVSKRLIFHSCKQNIANSITIWDLRLPNFACLSSDASLLKDTKLQDTSDTSEEKEFDNLYRSVEIECRGLDRAVLRSYSQFVAATSNHLQITLEGMEFPRYQVTRYNVLKSVFAHGKHKVQYEIRTYYLIMRFRHLTSSTADTFLEYIQRYLPEGVALKITKEELMPLPQHVKASNKIAPLK